MNLDAVTFSYRLIKLMVVLKLKMSGFTHLVVQQKQRKILFT